MEPSPRVPPQQFVESMKDEFEQYAKEVMEAVNEAPDGAVDRRQRRTGARSFRGDAAKVFERALQKRVDAAEAAFPPSARSDDGQAAGE